MIFCREDGTYYHPDLFSDLFERYLKRLELPRIRLHDMRHTYATLSLAAGVPPEVVSRRLGHSSTAFTIDTYGHRVDEQQQEAAEKVAGLIFGQTTFAQRVSKALAESPPDTFRGALRGTKKGL